MNENGNINSGFSTPAVYQIKVQGALSDDWSERLGGLQISVSRKKTGNTISILTGMISDQTALSGILNALYDSHITVLSVNLMKEQDR